MNWTTSSLQYKQTGFFSKIVLDYLEQAESIQPFYKHSFSLEGIKEAISDRKEFPTNRSLLVQVLQNQYKSVSITEQVKSSISLLGLENTFTICTAHQPNIFTGPLYFIYKILHAAKLAAWLKENIADCNFVPVYYMGSEDADLEELNHIYIDGEKQVWNTNQKGAVGRMKVDKALIQLMDKLSGRLSVEPFGTEIIEIIKDAYGEGQTIEQATFSLVNKLFGDYGVVVLLPDNALLKKSFTPVIEKELLQMFSHKIVEQTAASFSDNYKAQASGRELNMFYLIDDKRERIELSDEEWTIVNTDLKFSKEEILQELKNHPERFSPNVILRPALQEWILPDVAFIGGGGEIAYWLQLKNVFEATGVPYPVLVVRNSITLVSNKIAALKQHLGLTDESVFQSQDSLLNDFVKSESGNKLNLDQEKKQLKDLYTSIKVLAGKTETTLQNHTEALYVQALKKINLLEKKMLRAEKKKFAAEQRHIQKIYAALFPQNNLQERIDNLLPWYAKYGKTFIQMIYDNSPAAEAGFTILTEK